MHASFRADYGVNNPAAMIAVIDKLDQTQAMRGILGYDGTVIAW
jgi:hypothetical protein